jgi:2-hydroxy-6-oxonona-2,4-dienedioate hydrolase
MISYPAKIGDVTTRIFTAGTEGRPVMFVHGFGARADRWKLNMDPIAAAGFRAYAFDLPGHGFASKSDNAPSTVPEYSDFLGKVMDHLEVSSAVLVGTSLGGAVVASFAAQHSDRVEALVFVGSMGLVPIGEEIRSRIRAGSANQTLEAMQAKFKNIIADQSKVTVEMVEEEFHTNNSPGAAAALIKVGRYIGEKLDDDVVGQKIASLNKPTLLVWAMKIKWFRWPSGGLRGRCCQTADYVFSKALPIRPTTRNFPSSMPPFSIFWAAERTLPRWRASSFFSVATWLSWRCNPLQRVRELNVL